MSLREKRVKRRYSRKMRRRNRQKTWRKKRVRERYGRSSRMRNFIGELLKDKSNPRPKGIGRESWSKTKNSIYLYLTLFPTR